MKILDFSESFVACELNVVRYRQHIKLMKLCENSRSRSFPDLGHSSFTFIY